VRVGDTAGRADGAVYHQAVILTVLLPGDDVKGSASGVPSASRRLPLAITGPHRHKIDAGAWPDGERDAEPTVKSPVSWYGLGRAPRRVAARLPLTI
jgi:hypothetical protein